MLASVFAKGFAGAAEGDRAGWLVPEAEFKLAMTSGPAVP